MMDTEVIRIEVCKHPELNETRSPGPASEWVYWCSACKKKIAIPDFTLVEDAKARIAGIIGLAFGEEWEQRVRRTP